MKQQVYDLASESPVPRKGTGRLLALDILRGITIAGMILVNNPGSWGHMYAPLKHAEWNGLTPTDLVFPFFMFIMGISTYFSLRKYDFKFTLKSFRKILRRSVLLFLIGMAVAFVVSIAAIKFLMGYIRRNDFKPFGYYRIVLGILVLAYFLFLK